MDIDFILGVIIRHEHYFVVRIVPDLAPVSVQHFPVMLERVFTFWRHKILQARLVLPLPQPCSQPFLQGPLVRFSGKRYLETKTWVLGVPTAAGVLLFRDLFSR